jgi:hypothetical protein
MLAAARPIRYRRFHSFVKAAPAERDDAGAIFELRGGVDGAGGNSARVIADLEIGRFDEIVKVAIPKISLEDPPTTEQEAGLVSAMPRSACGLACCRPPRQR